MGFIVGHAVLTDYFGNTDCYFFASLFIVLDKTISTHLTKSK